MRFIKILNKYIDYMETKKTCETCGFVFEKYCQNCWAIKKFDLKPEKYMGELW